MSEFQNLISKIKHRRSNPTTYIPIPYSGLSDYFGITRKMYHLIGGDPGSGKTSFCDTTYIIEPYNYIFKTDTSTKLKTLYFSMERSKEYKKAKWLAQKLFTENNILTDAPSLLSFGWGVKTRLTDDVIAIAETHNDYFDAVFDNVNIQDGIENPTGIYVKIYRFALENGTLYKRTINDIYQKQTLDTWLDERNNRRDSSWLDIEENQCPVMLKKGNIKYVQDDDDLIMQVILDHIGKPRREGKMTSNKEAIDKSSEYLAIGRDLFGMQAVAVQQFNRNNANIQRRIHSDLTPEEQDFKGSNNPFEDCDVAIGLLNPYKHKLDEYKGYKIKDTVYNGFSRFRSMILMKNSYGVDNITAGFRFIGECGLYQQVPRASKITNYKEIFDV